MMIMGLLALLVAAPLQMTNQLFKTSVDRLVEAVDSNLAIRLFGQQFAGAQVVRSNIIHCTGASKAFKHEGSGVAKLILKPGATTSEFGRFSLPYASVSSVGAMLPGAADTVVVSDAAQFLLNDLVAMVSAKKSDVAGIFRVVDRDLAKSRLKLKEATIDDPDSDCRLTGSTTSLTSFNSSPDHRSVFVQRFHIANYNVDGNSIYLRIYPQAPMGKSTTLFAENFEKFEIDVQWQRRQAYHDNMNAGELTETEGTLWATISMNVLSPEIGGRGQGSCVGISLQKDEVCKGTQLYVRKSFKNSTRFVLSAAKRMNDKVQTLAVNPQNLFPTCYLKAEDLGYSLEIPPGISNFPVGGDYNLYKISGAVSEASFANVNLAVKATPLAQGDIRCFNAADLQALKAKANPIQPGNIRVIRDGQFALAGSGSKLDEMICTVKGGVDMDASMTYFDTGTRRSNKIECKASIGRVNPTPAATVYALEGPGAMSCGRNGGCSLPHAIRNVRTNERIYGRFWNEVECTWSGGAKPAVKCCEGLPKDPKLVLARIKLKAKDVKLTGALVNATGDLEVNCR